MKAVEISNTSTHEPIVSRRRAALQDVSVQQDVMRQFAEKYRFINQGKEVCVDTALQYLNQTFFRDAKREITAFHMMQVITVALETDLNPFNNELYSIWTPFGDLKVLATVDGWNRLATSVDLTERDFIYSDSSESVVIDGFTYSVPTWIECKLASKEKGTSHARAYFWEVYNNSANQTITWRRPSRALGDVAFVQALRKMIRITALSDSDAIADIDRDYEAQAMQSQSKPIAKAESSGHVEGRQTSVVNRGKTKELNINIDSIPVIELDGELEPEPEAMIDTPTEEVQTEDVDASSEASPSNDEPVTTSVSTTDEDTETPPSNTTATQASSEVKVAEVVDGETVDETMVPREVLMMIKPIMSKVKYGTTPIASLLVMRNVITDNLALRWFDQEVEKLQ